MRWIIVGAGAQGRITLDILRSRGNGEEYFFVDDDERRIGHAVGGVDIMGRTWLERNLRGETDRAIIAIGRNDVRLRLAEELHLPYGTAIHPSVVLMPSAIVEEGAVLCPGAIIGTGAIVRPHALINTGVIVEHDCVIGEGASLSPGTRMGGRVIVERAAFLGTGVVLVPRVTVGQGAIVGAGSVVTKSVPAGMLAYGVPARVIRFVDPDRDWPKLL